MTEVARRDLGFPFGLDPDMLYAPPLSGDERDGRADRRTKLELILAQGLVLFRAGWLPLVVAANLAVALVFFQAELFHRHVFRSADDPAILTQVVGTFLRYPAQLAVGLIQGFFAVAAARMLYRRHFPNRRIPLSGAQAAGIMRFAVFSFIVFSITNLTEALVAVGAFFSPEILPQSLFKTWFSYPKLFILKEGVELFGSIPVLWLWARISPAAGMILFENESIVAAIRRSWSLTKGWALVVFGITFTLQLASYLLSSQLWFRVFGGGTSAPVGGALSKGALYLVDYSSFAAVFLIETCLIWAYYIAITFPKKID